MLLVVTVKLMHTMLHVPKILWSDIFPLKSPLSITGNCILPVIVIVLSDLILERDCYGVVYIIEI